MKHTIAWWEIEVPDLEAAKKFYGAVFGWTFQSWKPGEEGYEVVYDGDDMVGGMFPGAGDTQGRRIHVTFDADDRPDRTLEDMLDAVRAGGGTVLTDRTEIGDDMGWFATVADPSGLVLNLSTDRPKV